MLEVLGEIVINKIDLIEKKDTSMPGMFEQSIAGNRLTSLSEPVPYSIVQDDLGSSSGPLFVMR